jgi:hypothetical protein
MAELSNVNLRTIQELKTMKNTPRKYIKILCDILHIDIPNSETEILKSKPNQIEIIINYFFNLLLIWLLGIIGLTTLDSS